MLIQSLLTNPIAFAIFALGLIIAITIHEFAHAWAADKLGDPTPRVQDRLTLNPLAHLDPVGTLMLLFVGFGWGKPVVFDPYNLKDPKRDTALIALAGPVSNIILAIILSTAIRFLDLSTLINQILFILIRLNVMLAVFNLIPVHPLDGGKILVGLLPQQMALETQDFLNRYGTLILIMLILPLSPNGSAVSLLIEPVIQMVMSILLPY